MTKERIRCVNPSCRAEYAKASMKSRGLCKHCYNNKALRVSFPNNERRRGAWRESAKPWTAYDRLLLQEAFDEGLSDRDIAARLGRSIGSVTKARQRLGLKVSKERQAKHCSEMYHGRSEERR